MRAPVRLLLLIAALVSATACGPTVDLTKGLEVKILASGWYAGRREVSGIDPGSVVPARYVHR